MSPVTRASRIHDTRSVRSRNRRAPGKWLAARHVTIEQLEPRTVLSAMPGLASISAAHSQTLADLPLTAQASISAAIGSDQAAYHVAASPQGFALANPANSFTANLQSGVLQLSSGAVTWKMSLESVDYGGTTQCVGAASVTAADNRIDCNYGTIDAWYVNCPQGLEQGFTVAQSPQLVTSANNGLLTVQLALGGDLRARANAAGNALTLARTNGTTSLEYNGLTAFDATGKTLPASLEVRAEGGHQELLIHVNDSGAQGPITIDPFVQEAKLTASDGAAGDRFAVVAINESGNTVVVGALDATVGGNSELGAAYVFTESGSVWTQAAKLSDGAASNYFGESVSISGETVVVGANGYGAAAYVFTEPASGWANMTETAKLTASDGAMVGVSVSISGNTVVATGGGAAYVFTEPTSGWKNMTQTAKLTASDGATGISVSISGNTVVVGAPGATVGGNSGQGAAYEFTEPASGWTDMTQTAKLTSSDGAASDAFGKSVSISGNTVVVGAEYATTTVTINHKVYYYSHGPGAAYMFTEFASGWTDMTQTAKLTASDGVAGDVFGVSVSISGNTVVVGASLKGPGAAYVFTEPASGWTAMTETAKLTASDGKAGDYFGVTLSISGNTVVVGALFAPYSNTAGPGAAYVFTTTPLYVTGVSSTAGTYGAGSTIPITVTFSEPVTVTGTPLLTLIDGGVATYASTSVDGTTLTFDYTVAQGENTADLDYASIDALALNGGSIADAAGNAAVLTLPTPGIDGLATQNIVIETTAPNVTGVSPSAGPLAGGMTVTIKGISFNGAMAVDFGGVPATSVVVVSDTQITAISPAGSGTVDVEVTNPLGASAISSADQFTYVAAPTVTGLTPTSGPTAGGTSVTITGTNLGSVRTATVNFGATAGIIVSDTGTKIVATSPAESAATVYVTVTTPGGTSTTSSRDQFTYTSGKKAIVSLATLAGSTLELPASAVAKPAARAPALPAQVANSSDTSDQQRKTEMAIMAFDTVFADYD